MKKFEVFFLTGEKITIEADHATSAAGAARINFSNGAVPNVTVVASFRSEALTGWRVIPDQAP